MDKLSKRETKEKIEWCEFQLENFEKGMEYHEGIVRTQEKNGLVSLIFFFFIIIFIGMYVGLPFILSIIVAAGVVIFLWKTSGQSEAEKRLKGDIRAIKTAQETLQYLRSRYRSLDDDD